MYLELQLLRALNQIIQEVVIRVIIAGSRTIKNYDVLVEAVKSSGFKITTVISGAAYGVDKLGERYAKENGINLEVYPANWDNLSSKGAVIRYNRQGKPYNAIAGHTRNELMATKADALILLHDGLSSGSLDMLKRANTHGLKVYKETVDLEGLDKESKLRNYNQSVIWAKTMIEDKDAVVLDTESCGGSKNDEIISIGIVRLHNGEVLFNSLLKPNKDVKFNWYATQVHGIEEYHLDSAPQLKYVWHKIFPILHNKNVLAYNFSSDKRMIEQTLRKHSLEVPNIEWHCIMKAYKNYSQSSAVTNLTAACKEMNAKAGTHDALDDALAAARLVHRISQEYKNEK